jgi:NAD(P)-dependent dehydrogenase (short-subunit alcohol dehydrogenase family)
MSVQESGSEELFRDPGRPQAARLAGKVAIVTGAGSRPPGTEETFLGNGKATSILFARHGARVTLIDEHAE